MGRIWPFSLKTRRGLDRYGHIRRKPVEDWIDMAIFIENPAGIIRIWTYSPKTRRGLDRYGHFHAKPGEDWTDMDTAIENSPRIGQIWPFSLKTRREWDEYGHSYRKLAEDEINIATAFSSLAGKEKMRCVFSIYLLRMGNKKTGRILSLVGMRFVRLACSTNLVDF